MTLLALQLAFRETISGSDDDQPLESLGMEIYRDAYRGRMLGALETSFERTRQWVGGEPFMAAACHYILAEPPCSWTLDDYGAAFPAVLAELFAENPEVAELAWLEWHMQRAFAARDSAILTAAGLAAAQLDEDAWDRLHLYPVPGVACRPLETNCTDIWLALQQAIEPPAPAAIDPGAALLVWRQDLSPHFRVTDLVEAEVLARLAQGTSLGHLVREFSAERVGLLLARWLVDGLIADLT